MTRVCQSDRLWSGNMPTCERKYYVCIVSMQTFLCSFSIVTNTNLSFLSLAVDCGSLSDPINGQVSTPDGTTFGSQAIYSCNEGFSVVENPIRLCEANRDWSGPEPTCASKLLVYLWCYI